MKTPGTHHWDSFHEPMVKYYANEGWNFTISDLKEESCKKIMFNCNSSTTPANDLKQYSSLWLFSELVRSRCVN